MRRVEFNMTVTLLKTRGSTPNGLFIDGISIHGRPYRAEISVHNIRDNLSKADSDTLLCVARELLTMLMKAGYSAPNVNLMKFAVQL